MREWMYLKGKQKAIYIHSTQGCYISKVGDSTTLEITGNAMVGASLN